MFLFRLPLARSHVVAAIGGFLFYVTAPFLRPLLLEAMLACACLPRVEPTASRMQRPIVAHARAHVITGDLREYR